MKAQRADQFGHPEILQRGAEEDGRQVARAVPLGIERGVAALRQLDLVGDVGRDGGVGVDPSLIAPSGTVGPVGGARGQVEHALELAAHANRPVHRRDVQRQHVRDLVHQLER